MDLLNDSDFVVKLKDRRETARAFEAK